MAQTDRQTDKATWWSVTAYNGEISLLEDITKYPDFVKKVYGGREQCPTTGREHFQGAIQCSRQVRMAAFKEWLPTAHFEVARQKDALVKYALKEDTATGDKLERVNPVKYYSADEILELIAETVLDLYDKPDYQDPEEGDKKLFRVAVNRLLVSNKKLAGQLMNPSLRNFWCMTSRTWFQHARDKMDAEKAALDGCHDINSVTLEIQAGP